MNFLKLTLYIINPRYIKYIEIKPLKYEIKIIGNVDGAMVVGSGIIKITNNEDIHVCEKKHREDYKYVTKWIKKNSTLCT